jgi:ribosomal protein S11
MESFETKMDRIERGVNKEDLGRESAPRKVERSRISITNVEDVGGTKNH